MDKRFEQERRFLKANWHFVDGAESDQVKGIPAPLQEDPPGPGSELVKLPGIEGFGERGTSSLTSVLLSRRSRRKFIPEQISRDELAYLLVACEGVLQNRGKYSFRTVPSGGARHPLDLYVFAHKVEGLPIGLYRYLPIEHALSPERSGDDSRDLDLALHGQFWGAACVFVWVAVPYRSEWRYGRAAQKLVALDAGHSCQNLYLACEALGLGTCAIGAYDQDRLDAYLGLDGDDTFALYAAPVGRPRPDAARR
jgi:SagB-type dehydrogenase family enzyme